MVYREDGDVFRQRASETSPVSCEDSSRESSSSEPDVEANEGLPTAPPPGTFCLCHGQETTSMIQCDGCNGWYHYSCVALSPEDPPRIATYHCPTCYRAGIGQSIWNGGAVFSKHQNRRVHEELLHRTDRGNVRKGLERRHQSQDDRPPPAGSSFRYERKREFYVKRLPSGELTTMRGAPIVVDPPYNAPLPNTTITPRYPPLSLRDEQRASRGGYVRSNNVPAGPLSEPPRGATSTLQQSRANMASGITKRQHSTDLRLSATRSHRTAMVNPLQPLSSVKLSLGEKAGCAAEKSARLRADARADFDNMDKDGA